jgi:RNA polymerase sigma-70 factor (ECF subfamily)
MPSPAPDHAAKLRFIRGTGGAPRASLPTPLLDDTELLSALRARDPGAATALHDRVRPQVDRTVARLLGRHDPDADDLAQLALIEIVYTIGRFRGDCSLDSWTSTLTARVVYKHIRRRQAERRIFGASAIEDLIVAGPQRPGREALMRDTLGRIVAILERMDQGRAWTFVLHDLYGYDLREIATITEVSMIAAQSRLVRGRRELHERIERDPQLAHDMSELESAT